MSACVVSALLLRLLAVRFDPELGGHALELLDIPQLVAGRLVDRHLPEHLHEVAAVIRMGCGTRGDHPA